LQGELRKIKPLTFNGEHRKGEVEAQLLETKKYFQQHDYPSRVETRTATYHLQGKAAMWWYQSKQAKHLDEKRVALKQFKGYFQEKYLFEHYRERKMKDFFELNWEARQWMNMKKEYVSDQYYERKMKELLELKLGSMTMDEYEKRLFKFKLKYEDFIKDEKVKIQRFLSGLPSVYSDKIQYDNPRTLEESIRRAKHLHEQSKGRSVFQKT
jgi:hypothetical protein